MSILLGMIIVALAIYGVVHPWVGVLGWTWISLMNPHAFSWMLATMPVAAAFAAAVLFGVLVTRDRRNLFLTRESAVLILFMLWMCITLPFSFHFAESYELWSRVMKIDLMVLMALVVLHTKKHILALAWVIVVSIGIYGVKGGLFTFATGGNYQVWGPEGSFIGGNNEVALALVMTIPLMQFLRGTTDRGWVKGGLAVAMLLSAVAALGSQSRGALLAIAAMALVLWWRGHHRVRTGLAFVAVAVALLAFMPETWFARMSSIQDYQQDDSAMQRLNAWEMAWNIAKDNVFGAGFMVSELDICARYSPIPTDCRAAHSIYFMVLGEHGFIGLFMFLLLWLLVWRTAGHLRTEAATQAQSRWLAPLGAMAQVSLVGYAVGGAFLSLSYYDLPYNILALVVLGRRWMEGSAWRDEVQPEPVEQTARVDESSRSLVS